MKIINGKGTYTTASVKKIIKRYLKIINVTWKEFWDKLVVQNIRTVFLLALKDFIKKKISIDEFSTIGNNLYYNGDKWSPWNFDLSDNQLRNALSDASELAYYNWRKNKNSQTMKSYKWSLKSLKNYYEKNKNLLKNFSKDK